MKSIKLIGIVACIIALTACRDTKTVDERQEDLDNNRIENRDATNQYNDNTTDRRMDNNQTTVTNEDMSQMYNYLNMSEEQIDEYERMELEYQRQAGTTEGTDNTLMGMEERRDRYFRDILSNDQYLRYEQWKRDNPNRNTNMQNTQNQNQ